MKLFNKIAIASVGAIMAIGGAAIARTANAFATKAEGSEVLSMSCDFTKKSVGSSAYNNSWNYDGFTVYGGANNNKGWDYVKMGGKSATLANANPVYIASPICEDAISKITVVAPSGSLKDKSMTAKVKVVVYSDEEYSNVIDETAEQTVVSSATTYTFTPTSGSTWTDYSYYKVIWTCTNTSTTNGIACVNSVNWYTVASLVDPDKVEITANSTMSAGETQECTNLNTLQDQSEHVNQKVTWSVTNGTGSATIDENGKLTALSAGTVTVKAAFDEITFDTAVITITGKTDPSALIFTKDSALPSAYSDAKIYGVDGVALEVANVMKNGNFLQLKKGVGYIKNVAATPDSIKLIEVMFKAETPTNITIKTSEDAETYTAATPTVMNNGVIYIIEGSNAKFFEIDASTTGAANIASVSILFNTSDEIHGVELAYETLDYLADECAALDVKEATWTEIVEAYQDLVDSRPNAVKFLDGTSDIKSVIVADFLERYDYIVAKYGYTNFLGRTIASNNIGAEITENTTALIIVISVISVSALAAFLMLKKKRNLAK